MSCATPNWHIFLFVNTDVVFLAGVRKVNDVTQKNKHVVVT